MILDVSHYCDIAEVPGQSAARDSMSSVDPDERRPRNVENRLQIPIDESAIVLIDLRLVAEAKRRFPPRDIMVAGNCDDPAHPFSVTHECSCPLKLPSSGALGEIT